MANDDVSLPLSRAEALVLVDLLARLVDEEDGARLKGAIEHDGEIWALNALLLALERALPEPLDAEHSKIVAQARRTIVVKSGLWPWPG